MKGRFNALKGQQVILSLFTIADITPEYIGWLNDPQVVRFSNQRFHFHSQKSCNEYLNSFSRTENLFLKITDISSHTMLGTMTAYRQTYHQTADMGILIGRRCVWGRGFGLDAWKTLLNWLLEIGGARKVSGGTLRENVAMVRIMEKAGMSLEAVHLGQELLDGKPQDLMYFSKFNQ